MDDEFVSPQVELCGEKVLRRLTHEVSNTYFQNSGKMNRRWTMNSSHFKSKFIILGCEFENASVEPLLLNRLIPED
jgi:hypothetical protein